MFYRWMGGTAQGMMPAARPRSACRALFRDVHLLAERPRRDDVDAGAELEGDVGLRRRR